MEEASLRSDRTVSVIIKGYNLSKTHVAGFKRLAIKIFRPWSIKRYRLFGPQ